MTVRSHLIEAQKQTRCEHATELGVACSVHAGGWWDCYCEMVARKKADADGECAPQNEEKS